MCKHCREVQPAECRLLDERQADRGYYHADVASGSIPDDASRACLRIDGIEDYPSILPKTPLFQYDSPAVVPPRVVKPSQATTVQLPSTTMSNPPVSSSPPSAGHRRLRRTPAPVCGVTARRPAA